MSLKSKDLILTCIVFAMPLVIALAFGSNGLYGQDAYAYLKLSEEMNFMDPSVTHEFFWPVLYPLSGKLISLITCNELFSLRIISALALAITFLSVLQVIKILYQPSNYRMMHIFVISFFVLSPYILRFSTLVMSDALCMMFVTLTFLCSIRNGSGLNLFLVGMFAVLSVTTRYAAFPVILVILSKQFYVLIRKSNWKGVAFIAIGLVLASLPHLYFKGIQPFGSLNHGLIGSWSITNFVKSDFHNAHTINYAFQFPNLIFYLGLFINPAYSVAGLPSLILLFLLRRKVKIQIILLYVLLAYLIMVCGIPFQNKRFLVVVFPFYIILIFPVFNLLGDRYESITVGLILLLIIQIPLAVYAISKPVGMSKSEQTIAENVKNETDESLPIFTSGLEGPLGYYLGNQRIQGLFQSEKLNFPEKYYLIIDSVEIARQDSSLILVKNVKRIYRNYHMVEKKNIGTRWNLYLFEE